MLPVVMVLALTQAPQAGMTRANPTQAPEAVVQRHVEAYNGRDMNALGASLGLDVKLWLFPDKVQVSGKTDCLAALRASLNASPELRMEVSERMVAGSRVFDHLWLKGRADGRIVRGVQIYEVKDGVITGIWFAVD